MRSCAIAFLLAVFSTWPSLAQTEPDFSKALSGEWHQIDSSAGKCADCRIRIERSGGDFTVISNNGWSAMVRPSFRGKPFVAGKGSWRSSFGGVYAGKEFFLNLGIKDDKLSMLMMVPDPDGKLRSIEATFGRLEHL